MPDARAPAADDNQLCFPRYALGVLSPLAGADTMPYGLYRLLGPDFIVISTSLALQSFAPADLDRAVAAIDGAAQHLVSRGADLILQSGTPLALSVYIMEYGSSACTPLARTQVDVWHADAAGVYSDESVESTVGQSFLRGYQLTDSNGLAAFKTIFPGWYSGRTVHIHVMIRTYSSSGGKTFEFTTQLFFDPALILTVMAKAPYNTRGNPDTTNATDNIYKSETLLSLKSASSGSGYTTSITLGVQA